MLNHTRLPSNSSRTQQEYQAIVDAEWSIIYSKLEAIAATGAKVVLSRLPIGDLATQYFADRDIFCAGRVAVDDLKRVVQAVGGAIQSTCSDIREEHLGRCERFEEKQIGGERFNLFEGCTKAKTCTLLLRGGAEQFISEVERSLHDAIMIVKRAIKNNQVVAGGGATEVRTFLPLAMRWSSADFPFPILALSIFALLSSFISQPSLKSLPSLFLFYPYLVLITRHVPDSALLPPHLALPPSLALPQMEISKYLRDTSRTIEGKQQLIISAFAKSLEVIPRQICDNAGIDATDVLNKLRMLHARGERWAGVDVENDGVADNMEKFVWEPALVKINALEGAAEAACVVLSVDETVTNPSSQVSFCRLYLFPRQYSFFSISLLDVLIPFRSFRLSLALLFSFR